MSEPSKLQLFFFKLCRIIQANVLHTTVIDSNDQRVLDNNTKQIAAKK